ncbi:PREDICTED: probable lipid phosphate phosphatase PPAPDC3 isoform X2 [Ceratosolen solmsi marchali]|uniref:Probable lipid phosphate phosphatase PPAPDC3 isoform X2 n=1 Tax=Ceratosolen solmsi marchali TaxID=326594 RepID=A0AAJ7DWK9_9HYME|nr:PREDICTED: probable lipid phosphate phosphatase PPAPDC3 isoform X2 [Ceratosolen solmsi marchali]
MNKAEKKRNLPLILIKILAIDINLTDQFVKSIERILAFRQLKNHYQLLEISCHGLLWIPCWCAFIWMFNNKNLYQMQINLFLGLLLDIGLVAIIKAITRRRRPIKQDELLVIGPDKFSFPSGHSSRAFFITYFFLNNWPVNFIFVIPLLCWSISVCISRILMRRHYLLDVIAGALLGILESYFIGLIYLENETCTQLIWWITDEKLDGD